MVYWRIVSGWEGWYRAPPASGFGGLLFGGSLSPDLTDGFIANSLDIQPRPDPLRHRGESAAIRLASVLNPDLLLMDDRRGAREAKSQGLRVTGTLGVLDLAAERGLVDFERAVRLLEETSFRKPVALLASLLGKHRGTA